MPSSPTAPVRLRFKNVEGLAVVLSLSSILGLGIDSVVIELQRVLCHASRGSSCDRDCCLRYFVKSLKRKAVVRQVVN